MTSSNVSIPVKLDAFVFNPDVCSGGPQDAKIAPISQPNYSFLRIENFVLQNDTLDHVDVHNATPANRNSRATDLGTGEIRKNRQGVYVHWMIPRPYRTGAAATSDEMHVREKQQKRGAKNLARAEDTDPSAPNFRNVPNRWLVIRKLDPNAPTTLPRSTTIDPIKAWIIESDLMRKIDDLDEKVDLQIDVSPFITSSTASAHDPTDISINEQAEVFIGVQKDAKGWHETTATRINLSLLSSSNQLFPDYQPHNSSVFSMLDTFAYFNDEGNQTGTLTDAVADYYVFGWHQNFDDDPFTLNGETSREARLAALSMTLNDQAAFQEWLESDTDTRVLCHGAMYSVEWHDKWTSQNAPRHVPANDFTKYFTEEMPAAVGTTSLDALLAYVEAHHADGLEKDIWLLGALLRAQSDSVSDQQAGDDEVQNYNFARLAGGTHYSLPIDPSRPAEPPSEHDARVLSELNQAQSLLDGATRIYQQKKWDTFSLWWKFVSDVDNSKPGPRSKYQIAAQELDEARRNLDIVRLEQDAAIDEALNKLSQKPIQSVLSEFNQQRDPTLFIGGVQAGWPVDYLNSLKVRLDSQIVWSGHPNPGDMERFSIDCLPDILQHTALTLVQEFLINSPAQTSAAADRTSSTATFPPLYHDQGDPDSKVKPPKDAPWRDRWESTQAWFPLFLEWEAEYTHIPFEENWSLQENTTRHDKLKKVRYGIRDGVELYKLDIKDRRTVSGRILLLPQPTFNLKVQIDRLFSTTPKDILDTYLTPEEREKLVEGVASLPFSSGPLDGFINDLLTLAHGNHLKPNVRVPGGLPQPLRQAYETSEVVGLGINQMQFVGIESDLTPYGSLVQFSNDDYPAFKPATHGQFRLTKLNVIDKFGQTACGIDQTPRVNGPPPFYPCISDYYEPQILPDNFPNVVRRPQHEALCEFMQVSAQINQPARLNGSFVVHDDNQGNAYWRPITEWENPIWGWLVVNYVDYGIQFFLQDGNFYREVRVAAPNGPHQTSAGTKWLPFKPGSDSGSSHQLDRLIERLTDDVTGEAYLEAFIKMVNNAVANGATAPSAYGQFVNSIVGKPLALVNAGFSLELASDAKVNESTVGEQPNLPQPIELLNTSRTQYKFPFKIGDKSRPHDGLVGYFKAFNQERLKPGDELDLTKLFTTYADPNPPIQPIDHSTFPTISAFWLDPARYFDLELGSPTSSSIESMMDPPASSSYSNDRNAQLTNNVFGCIMDPFLPLHVYSSILPIQPLKLPDWTWEIALKTMTAFFHFGPLLLTDDVPTYDEDHRLEPDYQLTPPAKDQTVPLSAIKIPALSVADWSWLQPYVDEHGDPEAFMALGLGQLDSKPKFDKGPYTAVEGYLQMKAPITGGKEAATELSS